MAAIERLDAADHAAVGRLLLEAYAHYAERMGPVEWGRLSEGLAQAAGRLTDAEVAGVRGPKGLDAVVFYFSPGKSTGSSFPVPGRRCACWAWRRWRADGASRGSSPAGASPVPEPQGWPVLACTPSEAMTMARGLYERMGFVVDDDLPTNVGLRYWRYRLNLSEEE